MERKDGGPPVHRLGGKWAVLSILLVKDVLALEVSEEAKRKRRAAISTTRLNSLGTRRQNEWKMKTFFPPPTCFQPIKEKG